MIAEQIPKFILKYNRELFGRVNKSKNDQVNELQSKLSSCEIQINLLKEKIDSEQDNNIEQQKKRTELEVELKIKDIEIQKLKRKGVKDLENMVDTNKALEERLQEKAEEIKDMKDKNKEQSDIINRLNAQIRDLRKNEDNILKKIELVEKEKNFMRNRTGSLYSKTSIASDPSQSGNNMTSMSPTCESLEEVWLIIKDVKEKMDKLKNSIQDGIDQKYKDLNVSVIEKDNEMVQLLTETDMRLRELKNECRNEIRKLKQEKKQEISELTQEVDDLKFEKVDLLKKINILELDNQNNQLNVQKLKIITEQLESIKKDLDLKKQNMTLDQEVIGEFVKQIEERESMKADLEEKYRDRVKRINESRERLVRMFQMILGKQIKKKYTDKEIQEYFDQRLTEEEGNMVLNVISDYKLSLKKKSSS